MGATRDFLKQNTAAAHRRLDETSLVAGLSAGKLSLHAYGAMLKGYQEFFSSWELRMVEQFPVIADELGSFRFRKSAWLAEDLETLAAVTLPGFLKAPQIPEDPAGLAGVLYVIEGSTLGGMHLSRSGKAFPGNAGRFFEGYGPETMRAWAAFVTWLEAGGFDESGRIRAAETANETFGWFQRKFTEIEAKLENR